MLVERGYDVVLTARTRRHAAEAAATTSAPGGSPADSADPDAFAGGGGDAGAVDLLVHAAGVMAGTFVRKESLETFESVLRTNLTSAFVVAEPRCRSCRRGADRVPVVSVGARPPAGEDRLLGVEGGTQRVRPALAKEVERDGISVHVVTTGPVATPMLDDVHFPMRTLGVDDVAEAVVWLDTLPGNVVLPEIHAVVGGRGAVRPGAVRARGGPPPRPDGAPGA